MIHFPIFRDPNFQLTDFIKSLRLELKTWRKVFWRLWGMCHATVCSLCEQPFQVGSPGQIDVLCPETSYPILFIF